MSKKARKHIWPVSLAMSLALVGVLAVVALALAGSNTAQAHGPCDLNTMTVGEFVECVATEGDKAHTHEPDPGNGNGMTAGAMFGSSSTSASAGVELTFTSLPLTAADVAKIGRDGGSVELFLEDDFVVPDSISPGSIYFTVTGGTAAQKELTADGGRVRATYGVEVNDGDFFGGDDDWAIQVYLPDLYTASVDKAAGFQGVYADQTLTMVITKSAGIKNPSEAGKHFVGYKFLSPTDDADKDGEMELVTNVLDDDGMSTSEVATDAKISLSDEDNVRGYELTVTGSGFNDGTTADVWVLSGGAEPTSCAALISTTGASKAGSALVGSDDKGVVTFEVTVPTFRAGPNNHVCMVDGESLHSSDVDQFELEPSIRVVPNTASSGDIINIFAQDFPTDSGIALDYIEISDQVITMSGPSLNSDGSATVSLEIPGQLPDGTPLQGTVRVDASWGGKSKNSKITVTGSELSVSESDVLPNETITITGNGYGSQTCIPVSAITLDNVPVMVDAESAGSCTDTRGDNDPDNDITFSKAVEVSNAGQFVATITLWSSGTSNPTLIAGIHTLSVEDSQGFTGDTTMAIPEPTVTVTPDVVGPRDYLVVTGENWPMDNPDNPLTVAVTVEIDDYGTGRTYPLYADNSGRFTVEHRVNRNVAIPSTNQVTATYESVVKVGSFSVPAATVTVTPSVAQPGDLISISATDMPVYTAADQVKIGGTEFNDPGVNTDRDGNITIDDLLVPGLDPGTFSVLLKVHETIAIGEIEVLAEDSAAGPGAMLPDALSELGDNLVRVFHFNDVDKSWDFYDPRDEFADLNTLTTLINGEPYWVLVSEGQEDVLLNGKARKLTCVGGDCWNQVVW